MDMNNRIKKLTLYTVGLFILSLGVGISVASNLGVSPVSALPYVISKITGFEPGMCTTAVFILYLLIQIAILRKCVKRGQSLCVRRGLPLLTQRDCPRLTHFDTLQGSYYGFKRIT